MRYCFLILFCLAGCCGRDGYIKEPLKNSEGLDCVPSEGPVRSEREAHTWRSRAECSSRTGPSDGTQDESRSVFQGFLKVQREYLDTQYLASCHVDSPDPRRCNFFGEQLIIQWKFPEFRKGVYLLLKVRGRNETIETVRIPVKRRRGSAIYRLTGQRYCDLGGILTYQVDVMEGDCLLERWSHQVWADLIEIKDDE